MTQAELGEAVGVSSRLNQIVARKRDDALRTEQQGTLPSLMIDSVKMEQVLNNLISNAIEHTPPGSEVVVRMTVVEEGVEVSVTDAGSGIPPADREALFAPFVRGKTKKPAGSKGVGLGLAISKKIVEAHGGSMWVDGQSVGSNRNFAGDTFDLFEMQEDQERRW